MSDRLFIRGVEVEPGCHVDGHWGQFGASRVLRIADDLLGTGFFDDAEAQPDTEYGIGVHELCGDEVVCEIADEAEDALNAATPPGFWWGWVDGEFYLLTDDDERGL